MFLRAAGISVLLKDMNAHGEKREENLVSTAQVVVCLIITSQLFTRNIYTYRDWV